MWRDDPLSKQQVCDTSVRPNICVNALHRGLLPKVTDALSGVTGRLEGVENLPVRFQDLGRESKPGEVQLPNLTPLGQSVLRGELTNREQYAWEAAAALTGERGSMCEARWNDRRANRVDNAVTEWLGPNRVRDDMDREFEKWARERRRGGGGPYRSRPEDPRPPEVHGRRGAPRVALPLLRDRRQLRTEQGAGAVTGRLLYARSRGIPFALTVLAATAALAVWAAYGLDAYLDPRRRVPVVALAPLLASAVIGTSFHQYADELDRTAVRPWWPRRLTQLLALTALAAAVLALAVLGHVAEFGAPAMVRNTLGAVGITAASAALIGARLSWMPTFGYLSAVYLGAPRTHGGWATVWGGVADAAGPRAGAWATAAAVFVAGAALYAWRGPRREVALATRNGPKPFVAVVPRPPK